MDIRIQSASRYRQRAESVEKEHNWVQVCFFFCLIYMIVVCVKIGLTGPEVNRRSQNHKNLHKWKEVVVSVRESWKSISLSVSVFVVWFLWNNLIKVAGWLNSERKLGYICLSFPLKSFFPPSDAPSWSHFHHLFIIWKGRESGEKTATISLLSQLF